MQPGERKENPRSTYQSRKFETEFMAVWCPKCCTWAPFGLWYVLAGSARGKWGYGGACCGELDPVKVAEQSAI